MEYYLFEVSEKNDNLVKKFRRIADDDTEYISYNKFLKDNYGEEITTNEDYIPCFNGNEVKMVLAEDQFNIQNLEQAFEVLFDKIYGGVNEEDNSYQWIS